MTHRLTGGPITGDTVFGPSRVGGVCCLATPSHRAHTQSLIILFLSAGARVCHCWWPITIVCPGTISLRFLIACCVLFSLPDADRSMVLFLGRRRLRLLNSGPEKILPLLNCWFCDAGTSDFCLCMILKLDSQREKTVVVCMRHALYKRDAVITVNLAKCDFGFGISGVIYIPCALTVSDIFFVFHSGKNNQISDVTRYQLLTLEQYNNHENAVDQRTYLDYVSVCHRPC